MAEVENLRQFSTVDKIKVFLRLDTSVSTPKFLE